MNRDIHPELGPRERFPSEMAVLALVQFCYPTARAEGSTGAERSYWVNGELVAHSWPIRRTAGLQMWARIKEPK